MLILFLRADADVKNIMNLLRHPNEENNMAERETRRFTWLYEKDDEKEITRKFKEAWDFVRKLCTLFTFKEIVNNGKCFFFSLFLSA